MVRKVLLVTSLSALASVAGLMAADTALKSGLQPGDNTPAFDVQDITGPNKGKKLCYV